MLWKNQTVFTEFLIVGFKGLHVFKTLVFILILTIYFITISGSLLIIAVVFTNLYLQTPMYIFLCNLFLSDIVLTTSIVPYLLHVIWNEGGTICIAACFCQFCIYATTGCTNCLLLTFMSYDRYLAICYPLRYTSIMDHKLCLHLILWSWFLSFMISVSSVILICHLQFCDVNTIDHFYCDLGPILQISCSDTSFIELEILIASIPMIAIAFMMVLVSYFCIFLTILKIPSNTGRQKAFSTCSSHLIVVCAYYGTLITLYIVPSSKNSKDLNKFLSLLYTVVTPLLNPVIYGLRSQDIRTALRKTAFQFNAIFI